MCIFHELWKHAHKSFYHKARSLYWFHAKLAWDLVAVKVQQCQYWKGDGVAGCEGAHQVDWEAQEAGNVGWSTDGYPFACSTPTHAKAPSCLVHPPGATSTCSLHLPSRSARTETPDLALWPRATLCLLLFLPGCHNDIVKQQSNWPLGCLCSALAGLEPAPPHTAAEGRPQ